MTEQPGRWLHDINGERIEVIPDPPADLTWHRVSGKQTDYIDQLSPTWRAQVPGGSLFRTGEGLVFVPRSH